MRFARLCQIAAIHLFEARVETGDTEVDMRQTRQSNERKDKQIGLGRATRAWVLLALTAALGVVGFLVGAGSIALGGTKTGATVNLHKTKLGAILVNSKGHTLYLFKKDRNGKSSCTGSCATFWPPLLAHGKPTAGSGVKAALLGTTWTPIFPRSLESRPCTARRSGAVRMVIQWTSKFTEYRC